MRVVTVGRDEVRGRLRDVRSGVVKGISSGGEGGWWWEVINMEVVTRGVVVRIGTRGLAGCIGTALCDCGVANRSCRGSSSEDRFCVRLGVPRLGMHKQGEGVHVVAVPDGFELSIVAALSDMGVRISTRSSNNNSLGRLRVEASVNARHLRKEHRESIRGGGRECSAESLSQGSQESRQSEFSAPFRQRVKKKELDKNQAAVKTASRTRA